MLKCRMDSKGVDYVLVIYPSVVCWQGGHIVHALLGIVVSVALLCISLIFSITFFEARAQAVRVGAK